MKKMMRSDPDGLRGGGFCRIQVGELSMARDWTRLGWCKFRLAAAGTLFLATAASVSAQDAPGVKTPEIPANVDPIPAERKLGLEECIAIAMEKQPAILAAKSTLAASIDKKVALDRIGLLANLATPEMSIRRQQCCMGIEQAEALVLKAEHETRQAVTYSYLMAVYAKQQHRQLLDMIENTKLLRRGAEAKAERFPGQVDLVDIALSASQSRLSDAENGIQQAIGALREAMGATDTVVPLHDHLPKSLNSIATREEAVQMALSNRPEMRQAELGQQAFGLEVCAQEKNRFSRRLATLSSATDIHAILVPPGEFVENYRPGALVPEMPAFIAGRRQDRVNQANDLHMRAFDLQDKVRNLVELEAGNVWLRWDKENRKGPVLQKGIELAAKRSEELKTEFSEVPKIAPRDVLEAGLIETTLRQQAVEAHLAALQALAVLERATGGAYRMDLDWSAPAPEQKKPSAGKPFGIDPKAAKKAESAKSGE